MSICDPGHMGTPGPPGEPTTEKLLVAMLREWASDPGHGWLNVAATRLEAAEHKIQGYREGWAQCGVEVELLNGRIEAAEREVERLREAIWHELGMTHGDDTIRRLRAALGESSE